MYVFKIFHNVHIFTIRKIRIYLEPGNGAKCITCIVLQNPHRTIKEDDPMLLLYPFCKWQHRSLMWLVIFLRLQSKWQHQDFNPFCLQGQASSEPHACVTHQNTGFWSMGSCFKLSRLSTHGTMPGLSTDSETWRLSGYSTLPQPTVVTGTQDTRLLNEWMTIFWVANSAFGVSLKS